MVTALAYLLLAVVISGGALLYVFAGQAQANAALDRRLAYFAAPRSNAPANPSAPISVPEMLAPLFAQAQLEVTRRQLQICAGGAIALVVIALLVAGPALAVAVMVGLPVGALAWLRGRARKRTDALIEALPYYIDGVRQLQSVGNSLTQSLERAMPDAPLPVRTYFAQAIRRLEMGAPAGDTLQQLANRLQIAEVSMLAAAVKTNLRFGGSVGTVLTNLANILRERVRVKRELNAATSESKVSAKVLIAMPLLCMAMLFLINPNYIDFFLHDGRGHVMILIAMTLQASGILVIRRQMRLEF